MFEGIGKMIEDIWNAPGKFLDGLDGDGVDLSQDNSPLAERGKRIAKEYTEKWPPEM